MEIGESTMANTDLSDNSFTPPSAVCKTFCPKGTVIRHSLKVNEVYKIPVWELNCQFGMVSIRSDKAVPLKDAVKVQRKRQKANVTVLFAVRRPG